MAGVLAVIAALAVWAPWRAEPERHQVRLDVDLGSDVALPPTGNNGTVILSPDGKQLVFGGADLTVGLGFRNGRGGRGPLFVRRLDQEKAVALPGTDGASAAFFSTDSRWIGFSTGDKLQKISVEAGPISPLGEVLSSGGAAWGEDGSALVADGRNGGLRRIPAGGGAPVRGSRCCASGESSHVQPEILPGGKVALFVVYHGTRGQITDDSKTTIEAVSTDRWSPKVAGPGRNFSTLPFHRALGLWESRQIVCRPVRSGEIGDARRRRGHSGQCLNFSFSRNGILVYRKGGGISGVTAMRAPLAVIEWIDPLGKRTPLIAQPGSYSRLRFSPDGNQLALLISDKDSRDEWIYDIRQGGPTKITFGLSITTPAWTGSGRYVIFGSGGSGIHWARADGEAAQALAGKQGFDFRMVLLPGPETAGVFCKGGEVSNFHSARYQENGGLTPGMPQPFFPSQFEDSTPEFRRTADAGLHHEQVGDRRLRFERFRLPPLDRMARSIQFQPMAEKTHAGRPLANTSCFSRMATRSCRCATP